MKTVDRFRTIGFAALTASVLLGTGAAVAASAPAAPSTGPTIEVNGQPFRGEADPKLPGCTVTLSISDLAAGPHTVAGSVQAAQPSGTGTLASVQDTFEGTGWSWTSADLTTAVTGLTQHTNGYRIVVDVAIDGAAPITSRLFWLACGAAQTGNPFVVVIDKQWQSPDGRVLSGPPADLPADWTITATSQLGDAVCTYPAGSDVLECRYENRGAHEGSTDGLYVPGGENKTFTITETAPAGWEVVSGVGTFVARDVCPGGGGDEGGHEGGGGEGDEGGGVSTTTVLPAATAAAEESRPPCPALVVDREVPSPTTSVPPTTVPASVAPASSVPPAVLGEAIGNAPVDALPRTGSDTPLWLGSGLGLTALGATLLGTRRRLARVRVRPRG